MLFRIKQLILWCGAFAEEGTTDDVTEFVNMMLTSCIYCTFSCEMISQLWRLKPQPQWFPFSCDQKGTQIQRWLDEHVDLLIGCHDSSLLHCFQLNSVRLCCVSNSLTFAGCPSAVCHFSCPRGRWKWMSGSVFFSCCHFNVWKRLNE